MTIILQTIILMNNKLVVKYLKNTGNCPIITSQNQKQNLWIGFQAKIFAIAPKLLVAISGQKTKRLPTKSVENISKQTLITIVGIEMQIRVVFLMMVLVFVTFDHYKFRGKIKNKFVNFKKKMVFKNRIYEKF